MSLQDKAMLATLTIKKWSGKGRDVVARDNLCLQEGAENKAVGVSKKLVFGKLFDELRELDTKARARFYALTLPWQDEGSRILAAKIYQATLLEFATFQDEFLCMADKVIAAMAAEKLEAQRRLGGLYKEDDYPADSDIRGRYSFDFSVMPIPSGNDFRVTLGDGEREKLQAEVETRVRAAEYAAKRDIYDRVAECVGRISESLPKFNPDAKGLARGTFRDTLVTNLQEIVRGLDGLNFDDDPRLTALQASITAKLLKHTAEELRESATARKEVAESAEDILATMAGYTGGMVVMPAVSKAA